MGGCFRAQAARAVSRPHLIDNAGRGSCAKFCCGLKNRIRAGNGEAWRWPGRTAVYGWCRWRQWRTRGAGCAGPMPSPRRRPCFAGSGELNVYPDVDAARCNGIDFLEEAAPSGVNMPMTAALWSFPHRPLFSFFPLPCTLFGSIIILYMVFGRLCLCIIWITPPLHAWLTPWPTRRMRVLRAHYANPSLAVRARRAERVRFCPARGKRWPRP